MRKLSVAGQCAGAEAEDFTAVLQAKGDMITEEDLELYLESNATLPTFALKNATEEKERILRALKQADGNKKTQHDYWESAGQRSIERWRNMDLNMNFGNHSP